ncbi:uncharacterized protein [Typha latifolia]|uniref:uncharacterized protein n=1 Tax=Typha latifolia TaxID=4733 RepID=UPI003C30D317
MDSEDRREHRSAGELDDETIARKRSRRVSFAETTAVHVFDRDEEFETPPESRPGSGGESLAGFHGELSDSDDSRGPVREEEVAEEDEEEDEDFEQVRFIKDMDSSSPGSVAGSVTSNDDENFFGPVSTSFIRSGRLSESGMSDDNNHDITLDSTAFSLHFRNVAPLDDRSANSAGSLRTPTGDMMPTEAGNLMEPVGFKKIFSRTKVSDGKASTGRGNSSDMSLITNNASRYDFGKLSPTLKALLDEVNMSLQPNSQKSASRVVYSDDDVFDGKEYEKCGLQDNNSIMLDNHPGDDFLNLNLSEGTTMPTADQIKICSPFPSEEENISISATISKKSQEYCKDVHEAVQSDIVTETTKGLAILSPPYRASKSNFASQSHQLNQSLFKDKLNECNYSANSSPQSAVAVPTLTTTDGQQQLESETVMHTPKVVVQSFQSPLQGSVSSLRAKREHLFVEAVAFSQSKLLQYSAGQGPPLSFETKLLRHDQRISAIKDHMSRSRILETPVIGNSSLVPIHKNPLQLEFGDSPAKVADNNIKFSEKDAVQPVLEVIYDKIANSHVNSTVGVDEKSVISDQNNKSREIPAKPNNSNFETSVNSYIYRYDGQNDAVSNTLNVNKEKFSSPSFMSPRKLKGDPLNSHNLIETVSSNVHCSPQRLTVEWKVASQDWDTPSDFSVQDIQPIQNIVLQDFGSGGRKRTIEHDKGDEENHAKKIIRTQSQTLSPRLLDRGYGFSPNQQQQRKNEVHNIGGNSIQKDGTHILSDNLEATKLVFSESIHKLTLEELDILKDILGELHISKKYEGLSISLRNHEHLSDVQKQRLAEARSLQDELLYEKAKLKLNRLKIDKLRIRAQLTQSKTQECHDMKMKISQLCLTSEKSALTKDSFPNSIKFISSSKNQEDISRVASMRHELKVLEQSVARSIKSIEVFCTIEEKFNSDEIIKIANKHLEIRNCCRVIHQDLRLWELNGIIKKNNNRDVLLNYCNLLSQRFTFSASQLSRTVMSNSLNEAKIQKAFPNMNACIAFEFVFNTKGDQRIDSLICVQQKALETSLVLGNLVDVLEEVKVAGMELLNLTFSTFSSRSCNSSRELELQLCFMNIKSGRKMALSLNMSDLHSAIYPSEPSELQMKICESQTTLPQVVLDGIMAAVQKIQGGRPMILRLCQLISKIVYSSSGT